MPDFVLRLFRGLGLREVLLAFNVLVVGTLIAGAWGACVEIEPRRTVDALVAAGSALALVASAFLYGSALQARPYACMRRIARHCSKGD